MATRANGIATSVAARARSAAEVVLSTAQRARARRVDIAGTGSVEPVSRVFGLDRGRPIDRHYIESFLAAHSHLIRGRVLEIGDDKYSRRFGSSVDRSEVLHATGESRDTTIVGDLATGDGIPQSAFDCLILTQTLPFIFDVRAAVAGCHRLLVPGGVVLATLPGISQISRFDMDRWGDFWRFTDRSAGDLFKQAFDPDNVRVEAHGNVATACAFLYGLAAEELDETLLLHDDPDYQVTITVVATRAT